MKSLSGKNNKNTTEDKIVSDPKQSSLIIKVTKDAINTIIKYDKMGYPLIAQGSSKDELKKYEEESKFEVEKLNKVIEIEKQHENHEAFEQSVLDVYFIDYTLYYLPARLLTVLYSKKDETRLPVPREYIKDVLEIVKRAKSIFITWCEDPFFRMTLEKLFPEHYGKRDDFPDIKKTSNEIIAGYYLKELDGYIEGLTWFLNNG